MATNRGPVGPERPRKCGRALVLGVLVGALVGGVATDRVEHLSADSSSSTSATTEDLYGGWLAQELKEENVDVHGSVGVDTVRHTYDFKTVNRRKQPIDCTGDYRLALNIPVLAGSLSCHFINPAIAHLG